VGSSQPMIIVSPSLRIDRLHHGHDNILSVLQVFAMGSGSGSSIVERAVQLKNKTSTAEKVQVDFSQKFLPGLLSR
jgi:hypothetical protein